MSKKEETTKLHKTLTIVGIVMCVILVPIMIINCTLLIKSFVNEDEVPSFGGMMPLIVLTDSMYPDIKSGDLIICSTVEPQDVEIGDVISFYDPAGNGTSVVTHAVIDIVEEDGRLSFKTKGINNNTEDRLLVKEEHLIAEYTGFRIPGAGNVAIFMQTTTGLIICVVVPIILLVGYDLIRRRLYDKSKGDDLAALKAELEALKAEKAGTSAPAQEESSPVEETPVQEQEPQQETPPDSSED